MRFSWFWCGVIISVIGASMIGFVFLGNARAENSFLIQSSDYLEISLLGNDLGYYKVTLPDIGDQIFVQIMNPQGSIVSDKKIETRVSVNYFDVQKSGKHTVKIINLGKESIDVKLEVGAINVNDMRYGGSLLFAGMCIVVFGSYRKLIGYKMAQPDENIS